MVETLVTVKALYNQPFTTETLVSVKTLYNAVGGIGLGEVSSMTIGRTVGFAYFSVPKKQWVNGDGRKSCNLGLTFGFWIWSTQYGKWVRGGENV